MADTGDLRALAARLAPMGECGTTCPGCGRSVRVDVNGIVAHRIASPFLSGPGMPWCSVGIENGDGRG